MKRFFHTSGILIFMLSFVVGTGVASAAADITADAGFGPSAVWHGYFCIGEEVCAVGDVNGDGKDDIVLFKRDSATDARRGDVLIALSNGSGFGPSAVWHDYFCIGEEVCAVGDVNGDGKDDIILFKRDTSTGAGRGDVMIALSNGSGFEQSAVWHGYFCIGKEVCAVGDVNGDGKDDIILFKRDSATGSGRGDVMIALSNGSGFEQSAVWHGYFCIGEEVCAVGDVNGDGKDDIVLFKRDTSTDAGRGDVMIALSNGSGFEQSAVWHGYFCIGKEVCAVGDVNGDGKDDIVLFKRDSETGSGRGDVMIALSTGSGFGPSAVWHNYFCISEEVCAVGDVNGDGRDDIIAFERTAGGNFDGDVWVALSVPELCIPTADQIALHMDSEYKGTCIVKSVGDYPNPTGIGLPNDSISSIVVGSSVYAQLCRDDNFANICEVFTGNDSSLTDNNIGNDQVSSVKITHTTTCASSVIDPLSGGQITCATGAYTVTVTFAAGSSNGAFNAAILLPKSGSSVSADRSLKDSFIVTTGDNKQLAKPYALKIVYEDDGLSLVEERGLSLFYAPLSLYVSDEIGRILNPVSNSISTQFDYPAEFYMRILIRIYLAPLLRISFK